MLAQTVKTAPVVLYVGVVMIPLVHWRGKSNFVEDEQVMNDARAKVRTVGKAPILIFEGGASWVVGNRRYQY